MARSLDFGRHRRPDTDPDIPQDLSATLPLIAPGLAGVATYALLLAWNEYRFQYVLLSSRRSMTVAAGINQFFDADEAPWSYLMSVTIVFSIPPIVVYYVLRRYRVAGLTMGGVKA
ncbi:MAG: carbohydrate ABC transporter permease [Gammaproteobacteria bacterium]|nr:carbohydrate ABC transporter permease [Gammaproteobacteria bacterium]